ncbi:MAG TPA: hypothetical protein VLT92_13285 [Burkholderiales bacterium]|nr:hypothetical protein [Burkholderiales bacterium]
MADKLLICVSAQHTSAAYWRRGRIADCRLFGNDDSGLAAFGDFLALFSDVPVYIMVDAVEEDYRLETLPHAFGSDRINMVSRKLRQHYRNAPFVAASLQGRDSGKRRDDRYLFSALTNPDIISDWISKITGTGLPMAGVYLLPVVSAALLDRLRIKATNLLIVAPHGAGLRLTFFYNQQLRLSRLTRNEGTRADGRAHFIADEISNTRLYLHAVRGAALDESLTVLLLDRNDELAESVQIIARDNPSLSCMRLGREELASRLGIARQQFDLSPDVVYLHLLGLKAPDSNLASAPLITGFRRYRARRALYAATSVAAMTALLWSGFNVYRIADANAQAATAAQQTAQQQALYLEATRQFPAAPASADQMKKTVEIAQKLAETARTPEMMMSIISKALETNPAVVIREFGWKHGIGEIEGSGTPPRIAETPAPVAGTASARVQSGLIEGEIRPFHGDYRSAIAAINAFASRLARDPMIAEARILKLPLNVNPTLALSGNTLETREQSGTADFKLLLVMKPKT